MPTKLTVAASFHRQVIVVFCMRSGVFAVCACSLPGERLAAWWCWVSCVKMSS